PKVFFKAEFHLSFVGFLPSSQMRNNFTLQPRIPGLSWSRGLSLLNSWDYRCAPPTLINFWT
uniref:Uncharacterized protein n=1 Tax=Dromaius novaehollandiae TaxID=8790 RepID=A0A8C4JGM2_DRONO